MTYFLKTLSILVLLFFSSLSLSAQDECEVDAGEDQSICAGESVVLGGNPTVVEGESPVLTWDNGAGNTANPSVSPASTTTYTVILSAEGCDGGDEVTDEVTITVFNNPVADFNINSNGPCSSEEVLFVDSSSGSNLSYFWDFGNPGSDGNTSTEENPTHTFLAPGNGTDTFTVTLTVTDENGCSDTTTQNYTVDESPDPSITDVDIFTPFVMCGPPGTVFDLSINNISSTTATNTNYIIDWGDGTAPFSGADWSSLDHTYAETGFFNLSVTVTGANGCENVEVYEVFVGNNPSVALGGGNTIGLCSPTETLSFPILNTQNNPPGTIYTVSYNDGSPDEIFTHPPPLAVEHVFNGSSCGVTSLGGFANSFHVRIIASNPCGQSSSTFEPVQTSSPPTVSMDVLPGNEWCSNTPSFEFVNTSTNAFFNNNGVCSNLMTAQWSISPATGWTITGGSLNDANGFLASFDPGTYTVTMTGANPCGSQTVSQEICATPPPEALFTLDPQSGCAPLNVAPDNLSSSLQLCDQETYFWEVIPSTGVSFSSGSSTSIDPEFLFSQAGNYTVRLTVTNLCGSSIYTLPVNVTEPPTVSINSIPNFCEGASVSPSAVIDNGLGTISNYTWDLPGGTPNSSNSASPGVVVYNNDGNYTLTLSVTNECGTATDSESFLVESAPDIIITSADPDQTVCQGSSIALTASGGTNYSWNSNSTLNTTSGANVIATPNGSNTYTVNATSAIGCPASESITLDVHPLPIPVIDAMDEICAGDCLVLPLTVSGGTAPYTSFSWTPATGLSDANAQNPNACPPTTTNYEVTVTDANGCQGITDATLVVNPLPIVEAGTDITLCNQPVGEQLSGFSPTTGGTGVWSGTNVTPAGVYTPSAAGDFTVTYTFTDNNSCVNSDVLNIEVIEPTTADAGADFSLCASVNSIQLIPVTPGGTWSGNNVTPDGEFFPSIIGNTTLTYTLGGGSCLSTDELTIEVLENPSIDLGGDENICAGDEVQLNAVVSDGLAPYVNPTWSPATGLDDPTSLSPTASPASTTVYSFTIEDDNGCTSTEEVTVNVLNLPIVEAGSDLVLCNQPIPETLTGFSPLTDANGTGEWSGSGVTPDGVFTPSQEETIFLYYTYTNLAGCFAVDSIEVQVADPQNAFAGDDFALCLNAPAVQLASGGTWSGSNVDAGGLFTPSVAGIQTLTYTIGSGTCQTSDEVDVEVYTLPEIDLGVDVTICEGDSVQLEGIPSGDNPPFNTFSWSGGSDLSSTNVANPWASPSATDSYSLTLVDGVGCSANDQITVFVNAAPIIDPGADLTLCDQAIPEVLTGFSPQAPGVGTWSGTGITDPSGIFESPGIGSYYLVYEYTDGIGCGASDSILVDVIAPVIVEAGSDESICLNNGALQLSGFSPVADVNWFGDGISDPVNGVFDPLITNDGDFTLYLEFGAGTCYSIDSIEVEVLPLPQLDPGTSSEFCGNVGLQTLENFSPLGGTWEGIGIVDAATGLFDPSIGAGTADIFYWYTSPITGCSDTIDVAIDVLEVPVALIDLEEDACTNSPIDLTNNSTGATSYYWDWGNGDEDFLFEPNYTFPDEGTFDITFIAYNDLGCSDTTSASTNIINPPLADFAVDPDNGCAPLDVAFENLSVGQDLSYLWDLATTSSIDETPANVVYQQGPDDVIYEVSLTASNYCGSDVAVDEITVFPQPVAEFGTDLDFFCSPWTINISNTSVGNPDTFEWDFGDGGTSTLEEPSTHIFTTDSLPTDYTITLITSNECGVDTFDYTVTVLPNTVNAFFNTNITEGCEPLEVEFTDFSEGATTVSYDFGDDNVTNNPSPTHTFLDAGTYTVFQFADNGCSYDTTQIVINVFESPEPNFTTDVPDVCEDQAVQFFNQTPDVINVDWDFGDGTTSNVTNPFHTFESGETFPVTMSVVSALNDCPAEITQNFTVYGAPEASFSVAETVGCTPFTVDFTNETNNGLFYQWDFGDNETGSGPNPEHTFFNPNADPLSYDIEMIAQNLQLCADTFVLTVVVSPSPVASFVLDEYETCQDPIDIQTTNTSVLADNYAWDFGPFGSANIESPGLTIEGVGTYPITLTASNAYGCEDEFTDTFTIHPTPEANFSSNVTEGCEPLQVQFTDLSDGAATYLWNFDDAPTSQSSDPFHVFNDPGVYDVSMFVQSDQGCLDTLTLENYISVFNVPVADFYVEPEVMSVYDPSIQLFDNSQGADLWFWNFGDGFTSNAINPEHTYDVPGDYTIDLLVATVNGCQNSTAREVTVEEEFNFFVPNTFTPDGDNINDFFQPVLLGEGLLEFYEFQIFDRWGVLVFQTNDPNAGWVGDFQDNYNTFVADDVYNWRATIRLIGSEESTFYEGHVNVLR